jgi:5'-nucleotidase
MFIDRDPDTAAALLDQKYAGKKLVLITNSGWEFTNAMMSWAFDIFLPEGQTWRDLFEFSIVEARKPAFFELNSPTFEVNTETGLLKPTHELSSGGVFHGGNAALVERHLGISGDEILYVGDHIFGDVKVSKVTVSWRTALVLRELERDIQAECQFSAEFQKLNNLMLEKEEIELNMYQLKLDLQRGRKQYSKEESPDVRGLDKKIEALRSQIKSLDDRISPLARAAAEISNPNWGLLMRAGNDKSHLARQVERSADIYMSRVANFLTQTPFAFLRSARGSLPHDQV